MSSSLFKCTVLITFCFISPIKLVVAKCWDPNPTGYFTIPRTEPVRPIDPGAWVAHIEATRGNVSGGKTFLYFYLLVMHSKYVNVYEILSYFSTHFLVS